MSTTYVAFAGPRMLARGELALVLAAAKSHLDNSGDSSILFFEEGSGKQTEFDLSGSSAEVLARVARKDEPVRVGPGRPKLGVVSREVSLLPRHWSWLELEPQGISATLRRLVEEAQKKNPGEQQRRLAREATYRFLTAMAGNLEHYEEATRALFAQDETGFASLIRDFPTDIREEALRLFAVTAS